MRSGTDVTAHKLFNYTGILFEEVSVDLKLLLEHHLPPIFDDQRVRLQVFCCAENLPVFLNSGHPTQLKLQGHICYNSVKTEKQEVLQPRQLQNICCCPGITAGRLTCI